MSEELSETRGAAANGIVAVIDGITDDARADLGSPVEIDRARVIPAVHELPLEKTQDGKFRWRRIEDASVVATDLKSSTAVSYSTQDPSVRGSIRHPPATARGYLTSSRRISWTSRETGSSRSSRGSDTRSARCAR